MNTAARAARRVAAPPCLNPTEYRNDGCGGGRKEYFAPINFIQRLSAKYKILEQIAVGDYTERESVRFYILLNVYLFKNEITYYRTKLHIIVTSRVHFCTH